ncbi:unnamed protein product [Symbiodinium sp. CCMP2456]|nr:unnamed protein product [Symbiodinium sp. CCMP2456]
MENAVSRTAYPWWCKRMQTTRKRLEANCALRMCFNAAHLELVTAVGDLPPEALFPPFCLSAMCFLVKEPEIAPENQAHLALVCLGTHKLQSSGARMCRSLGLAIMMVGFTLGLALHMPFQELLLKRWQVVYGGLSRRQAADYAGEVRGLPDTGPPLSSKASSVDASVERVGIKGEGGIKVGDQVIILAPPHHKGKAGLWRLNPE